MDTQLESLREQLTQAAKEFSTDASALSELLEAMVGDVERAEKEPLEIVPVAHHSPACGLHMLRRLQSQRPKAIFIELCEDMTDLLPKLGRLVLPLLGPQAAERSSLLLRGALGHWSCCDKLAARET